MKVNDIRRFKNKFGLHFIILNIKESKQLKIKTVKIRYLISSNIEENTYDFIEWNSKPTQLE
jgi:hypothetical protein